MVAKRKKAVKKKKTPKNPKITPDISLDPPKSTSIPEEEVAQTTEIEPSEQIDRVIRVGKSKRKNAACPKCGAFPTVTRIRRKNYELRRCRECEHAFEVKG